LRSFVSQLVAMARGNVYHVPARTSVELHKLRIDPQAIVLLDKPGKLVNTMRYVTQQCDSARRLLVGRDVLDLTYEDDVAEDPLRAYRRICDFLGVKNEPVEIRYGRTTPQKLTEIIENFDEVKAALAGTEFEWMAEE
jgi:16S rRNA C1402 (ribose-2'-O) methylase RsmI